MRSGLVISLAILCDALELVEPALKWNGGGRRIRKYKMPIAITSLVLSLSVLAWRLRPFVSDRVPQDSVDE